MSFNFSRKNSCYHLLVLLITQWSVGSWGVTGSPPSAPPPEQAEPRQLQIGLGARALERAPLARKRLQEKSQLEQAKQLLAQGLDYFSYSPEQRKTLAPLIEKIDALLSRGYNLNGTLTATGSRRRFEGISRSGPIERFHYDNYCELRQIDEAFSGQPI